MRCVSKPIMALVGMALFVGTGCSPTLPCGAIRDRHGCIPSAGYAWSSLEGRCLRPFEEGIPLHALHPQETSFAAYLLISDDEQRIEVFTVNTPESVVLGKVLDRKDPPGHVFFENKKEKMDIVKKDIGHYLLRIGGNERYASDSLK